MSDPDIIQVSTGNQLTFDREERKLWISLEGCDSMSDVAKSTESLIVAGSEQDVDFLIEALTNAKAFFRS